MEPGLSNRTNLPPAVALEGTEFRRRYLRLVIATWTLPVLTGTLFEIFVGMVTAKEVLLTLFAGFSGLFVVAFLVFATFILYRRSRVITGLVEALPQRPAAVAEIKVAVRRMLTLHIGLFLIFNIIGPQTTLLTDYFLYLDSSSNTTSFGLLIGILAPILLIALPLFFLVTDMLGRYLAPHGVMFDLAPLRFKYLVLGLITPALVDVTLLLYFYDRTGFFHPETLIIWLGLLIVAGLGTALAWRSLGQSLTPLKEGLAGKGFSGDNANRPLITPQSLDELGLLALDWNRAAEKERLQKARYRDLVEGSIQGILVHQDFRLLFANQAMAEIMGYESVPEFLALGSLLELIPAEDRAKAEEIKTARMEGEDMPERYELRALRRDGSAVWLENVARIVNWDGEPAIQATVVDVTERKLAEEALRRSEDSLRRAQHIAKIGNWERDITKGELYWSDEMYELFGLDRGSVRPPHDFFLKYVHPDDEDALRDNIDQVIAGEAPYDIDFRVIRPNGEQIVVHAQGEIDRDIGGQPVYFRGTAQDVTKLREAEAQIRLLNEELEERVERRTQELRDAQSELIKKQRLATLGQLTATVSHELRNPLGAMRTSVFVLEKNLPAGSDGMRRALARIERGIQRCDRIVDELLDYTRSITITKEPIDVDRWLAGVLSEQPVPEEVEISTDLQLGNLAVMMDPGRMRRAIINVVENACQAMTGEPGRKGTVVGGRVNVASKKVDGNIEIRISDNGPGMSAETREKIYEPLFSTKNFGVGLGLPTVQKILEQHGGHVLLESEPGVGSVFHLVFPLEMAGRCRPATIGDVLPVDIEES